MSSVQVISNILKNLTKDRIHTITMLIIYEQMAKRTGRSYPLTADYLSIEIVEA